MPVKMDSRAHVSVKVGELEILALVDTGATWPIIPKEVLEKFFLLRGQVREFKI